MPDTTIKVHFSAATAMDGLADTDRQRVIQAVERLQKTEPPTWPTDEVTRLPVPEPLYVLRVPPNLRIMFRRSENHELEIRDIFREELLDLWFRPAGRNGGVPR